MASYVKYEIFPEHLANKVHDLFGSTSTVDDIKLAIHTDAPVIASDTTLANLTQITGTGYPGTNTVTPVGTRSGGTFTLAGSDVVWTAGASDWSASARYVSMYNDTPTSPADPLIAYWDYGTTFALANGETFTADFGATIFTFA